MLQGQLPGTAQRDSVNMSYEYSVQLEYIVFVCKFSTSNISESCFFARNYEQTSLSLSFSISFL